MEVRKNLLQDKSSFSFTSFLANGCFNEICILFFTDIVVNGATLIQEKPSPYGGRELKIRTWTHGIIKVMKDRYGKNSYL